MRLTWTGSSLLLALLLLTGCVIRIERPAPTAIDTGKQESPRPVMSTEGMDEYSRHKLFASRYIEEGDYPSALEELSQARILRQDDPRLFELLALAHDGERESSKAYENFLLAGRMYIDAGDMDSAWRVLGWIGTYPGRDVDPRAAEIEEDLRAWQQSRADQ